MRVITILSLLTCFFITTNITAQETPKKDTLLPYQKYPTLPAFNVLLTDSTVFNTYNIPKGKTTLLILFGADCDHCQHFAEKLSQAIDSFKNVNIYMFTFSELADIREFGQSHGVSKCTNITLGRDYDNFFPAFYGVTSVPFVAIYDKRKKFVRLFDGGSMKELYRAIHQ